jgi:hypothetical protein
VNAGVRLAASAVAGALAVAACGGGGQLSMTSLRNQASQVCDIAAAKDNRIPTPATPAGTAAFLERGLAVLRPELSRLRALRPPSDVADVYSIAIGAFEHKVTLLGDAVRGLGHGDDPSIAIRSLQQRLAPTESAEDGAWRALEIPACLNR